MSAKTLTTASLSRQSAAALVSAAREAAKKIGVEVSIAVTDAGAHLRAFERTDASLFLTVDIAIDKAWTAASFGMPTHAWPAILANPNAAHLRTAHDSSRSAAACRCSTANSW